MSITEIKDKFLVKFEHVSFYQPIYGFGFMNVFFDWYWYAGDWWDSIYHNGYKGRFEKLLILSQHYQVALVMICL